MSTVRAARGETPVKNPGTFIKVEIGELESLDPVVPYDTRSWEIMCNVYETLVVHNRPRDVFLPRVARTVPSLENGLISADGLTYRFPIRTGARFHGGQSLTARDVEYSLRRLLISEAPNGPGWMLMEPLLGVGRLRDENGVLQVAWDDVARAVEAVGDEVVLRLRYPFAPLLAILATPPTSIVCMDWAAAGGEWPGTGETWLRHQVQGPGQTYLHSRMNGTGPYRLVAWEPERRVQLIRHDAYWGPPAPCEHALVVKQNDWPERRRMLLEGDADMVQVDRTFVPEVAGAPGVTLFDDLPLPVTDTISMALRVDPADNLTLWSGRLDGQGAPPDFFSDLETRRGFQHAFDRERLVRDVYLGKAVVMRTLIPAGISGHNPDQGTYDYDLAAAAEHLRRAHGGRLWDLGFRMTLCYNAGNVLRKSWAEYLRDALQAVNPRFRLELAEIDLPRWRSMLGAGKLPIFTAGWLVDYPDPHDFVQPMLSSWGQFGRWQSYCDRVVDQAIMEGVRELDAERRVAIYHRLQTMAHESAKDIYTIEPLGQALMRSWVRGWEYDLIHGPQAITLFYELSKG